MNLLSAQLAFAAYKLPPIDNSENNAHDGAEPFYSVTHLAHDQQLTQLLVAWQAPTDATGASLATQSARQMQFRTGEPRIGLSVANGHASFEAYWHSRLLTRVTVDIPLAPWASAGSWTCASVISRRQTCVPRCWLVPLCRMRTTQEPTCRRLS